MRRSVEHGRRRPGHPHEGLPGGKGCANISLIQTPALATGPMINSGAIRQALARRPGPTSIMPYERSGRCPTKTGLHHRAWRAPPARWQQPATEIVPSTLSDSQRPRPLDVLFSPGPSARNVALPGTIGVADCHTPQGRVTASEWIRRLLILDGPKPGEANLTPDHGIPTTTGQTWRCAAKGTPGATD